MWQELENNENVIQQIDNSNCISDEGDGNNQPYFDAQTENEPDTSDTDKDEVNEVIAENTENENTNKYEPKDDDNDDNYYQPDGPRQSKRKNKGKLKEKGPYQFENNSLAHRANKTTEKWDNYIPSSMKSQRLWNMQEYAHDCTALLGASSMNKSWDTSWQQHYSHKTV